MSRRWSTLCAAMMAAQTLLQTGSPAVIDHWLTAAALTLETGLPWVSEDVFAFVPAGEGIDPFPAAATDEPEDAEALSESIEGAAAPEKSPAVPAEGGRAESPAPAPEPPGEGDAEAGPPETDGEHGDGPEETPPIPGPEETALAPGASEEPEASAAPESGEPESFQPEGEEPESPGAEANAVPIPPEPEVRPFTDTPGVEIKNNTSIALDMPALLAEPLALRLSGAGPQVLIIHTHGTEAYLPTWEAEYESTDAFRTTDAAHSVIRVGDVLQQELEALGLQVVHDRGLYDYPSYAGSYARSQAAAEEWLRQYPGIGVIIDLHRDAVGDQQILYKTSALVTGESSAQVMLVVGTGENGLEHPHWRENLKLALAMQAAMDGACPTLTRPIHLVPERYNQHLTTGSLILEVGTNGNTLSEAERAVTLFARTAGPVLAGLVE